MCYVLSPSKTLFFGSDKILHKTNIDTISTYFRSVTDIAPINVCDGYCICFEKNKSNMDYPSRTKQWSNSNFFFGSWWVLHHPKFVMHCFRAWWILHLFWKNNPKMQHPSQTKQWYNSNFCFSSWWVLYQSKFIMHLFGAW